MIYYFKIESNDDKSILNGYNIYPPTKIDPRWFKSIHKRLIVFQ